MSPVQKVGNSKWIYLTFPPEGGRYTIKAGTSYLDVYEGEFRDADATKYRASVALKLYDEPLAHSFYIETSKRLKFRFDDGGWFECDQNDHALVTFTNFRIVTLHLDPSVSDTADVSIFACTNPEAVFTRGLSGTYGVVRPIKEWKWSAPANTAMAVQTSHDVNWRLSSISGHFTAPATCDLAVTLVDLTDANYNTVVLRRTLVAETDFRLEWGSGEFVCPSNKEVRVDITAPGVGVETYLTVITEDMQ